MRVSIHQPDLLPYSGFWYKMATSDKFVLAVHDQFQKHGYQRRVQMRGTWCSHRLVGKPSLVPISSVRVQPGWQGRIADQIRGRYSGARHWATRGVDLVDRILESQGESLDEVNVSLIRVLAEVLEIRTELVITSPPRGASSERLIEQVLMVGGDEYLAGPGGRAYMGDDAVEKFAASGVRLSWSAHQPSTSDSIVTVLMDEDDPQDHVLRSHDPGGAP